MEVETAHKDGKGVSTTNLIGHIRRFAKRCPAHKFALAEIEAASCNCIECDGETVLVYNFSESFSYATCPPTHAHPHTRACGSDTHYPQALTG